MKKVAYVFGSIVLIVLLIGVFYLFSESTKGKNSLSSGIMTISLVLATLGYIIVSILQSDNIEKGIRLSKQPFVDISITEFGFGKKRTTGEKYQYFKLDYRCDGDSPAVNVIIDIILKSKDKDIRLFTKRIKYIGLGTGKEIREVIESAKLELEPKLGKLIDMQNEFTILQCIKYQNMLDVSYAVNTEYIYKFVVGDNIDELNAYLLENSKVSILDALEKGELTKESESIVLTGNSIR